MLKKNRHFSLEDKPDIFINVILLLSFLSAYPLAIVLPDFWAWEDGPLEWLQAGILFANVIIAFRYSQKTSHKIWTQYWLAQIPFWLILFSRETSWGAAFLPIKSFDIQHGPGLIPLRELWYRPIVYPTLAILFLTTVLLISKYKLYKIPLQLLKEKRFPLFPLTIAIFAASAATCFEKDLWLLPGVLNQILEEYLETVCYIGISVTNFKIYFRATKIFPTPDM
jgi:hypothetical protein